MSDLRGALELIRGAKPTPDEINRITAFAHMLDIPTNDVMFPIVVSQLMMHDEIDEKLKSFLKSFKASTNITKEDLVQAVANAAIDVSDKAATKQAYKMLIAWVAILFLSTGSLSWLMYDRGYDSGYNGGYSKSVDEKAAAAWANTPEGKMAYKLAQTDQFKNIVHCNSPGWNIENGYCFPNIAQDNKIHGWKLPSL